MLIFRGVVASITPIKKSQNKAMDEKGPTTRSLGGNLRSPWDI